MSQNQLPATVHVIDDEHSVRQSLDRLLRSMDYRVALYSSAADFLSRPPQREGERGCILLDVQMPGLSGPALQDELNQSGCLLPIVFITGHGSIPMSVRAIKAGAADFLSKPFSKDVLTMAIGEALTRYDDVSKRQDRLNALQQRASTLTPRERQVFNLVVRGKMNKQIAYDLGASERTIKAHRHSIMNKFEVRSLAELVSIAEHLGVLDDEAH